MIELYFIYNWLGKFLDVNFENPELLEDKE